MYMYICSIPSGCQIQLSTGDQLFNYGSLTSSDFSFLLFLQLQLSPDGFSHGLNDPREEALATEGEYARFYETLGPIGRGAFGFVKMAQHREEKDMLVGMVVLSH